ncbi:hypothetical protein D3C81_1697630 [compost metagenome]
MPNNPSMTSAQSVLLIAASFALIKFALLALARFSACCASAGRFSLPSGWTMLTLRPAFISWLAASSASPPLLPGPANTSTRLSLSLLCNSSYASSPAAVPARCISAYEGELASAACSISRISATV